MKKILVLTLLLLGCSQASYSVPLVTYTTTGTSGNYTLDFTLTNTIDPSYDKNLYFWEVNLAPNSIGSPNGWGQWNNGLSWNTASGTTYQSVWSGAYLSPGASISGFTVNAFAIPLDIKFYAYAYGSSIYALSDSFNSPSTNPGFEGTATLAGSSSDPEPAALMLLGIGLAGLGFTRRRKHSR